MEKNLCKTSRIKLGFFFSKCRNNIFIWTFLFQTEQNAIFASKWKCPLATGALINMKRKFLSDSDDR